MTARIPTAQLHLPLLPSASPPHNAAVHAEEWWQPRSHCRLTACCICSCVVDCLSSDWVCWTVCSVELSAPQQPNVTGHMLHVTTSPASRHVPAVKQHNTPHPLEPHQTVQCQLPAAALRLQTCCAITALQHTMSPDLLVIPSSHPVGAHT